MLINGIEIDTLLSALSEELASRRAPVYELCIIGGSALGLLGLIDRPTKDIDIVALGDSTGGVLRLRDASELPGDLADAIAEVSVQLGVDEEWLNNGPASLLDCGLPDGFQSRLTERAYGPNLRVHVASRTDQICFKTYAAADVAGRHLTDLLALSPTSAEMESAFAWVLRHDASPGFQVQLKQLAEYLEVSDALESASR